MLTTLETLSMIAANALIARAGDDRVARAQKRPVTCVERNGHFWRAQCRGGGEATYTVTIKVADGRTYACSCADHAKRRGHFGPCKHVISLAKEILYELEILNFMAEHDEFTPDPDMEDEARS